MERRCVNEIKVREVVDHCVFTYEGKRYRTSLWGCTTEFTPRDGAHLRVTIAELTGASQTVTLDLRLPREQVEDPSALRSCLEAGVMKILTGQLPAGTRDLL